MNAIIRFRTIDDKSLCNLHVENAVDLSALIDRIRFSLHGAASIKNALRSWEHLVTYVIYVQALSERICLVPETDVPLTDQEMFITIKPYSHYDVENILGSIELNCVDSNNGESYTGTLADFRKVSYEH